MIGKTLSHYRITAGLGSGGMGVVFRAHDELLKRDVALKLLKDEMGESPEHRARILSEARAASGLNHPGIATVYEIGEEADKLFIVMEFVEGETLRRRLEGAALEPEEVVRIGAQVADALDAAHRRGIVHGDLKPENIILQADGRPKLVDFGIARLASEQTASFTRTISHTGGDAETPLSGNITGTLGYMAPEALRGEAIDARADLYSLGVVLFELAAGRRPFSAPTIATLMAQVIHEPAPRLGGTATPVPAELARVVQKLLEKDPATRFQSARELQLDLTNLLRELELGVCLPGALLGKRTVAVLPFRLLAPNPEEEYLGVALADAIINHLGGSGEVLVRPINAVSRYARQAVDPLRAAREMNVQIVVEGSIQRSGSALRVHVQAWNASDGATLLTAKYGSEITGLFELQDKVSEDLARSLGLATAAKTESPKELAARDTRAYELYLRAVDRLSHVDKWDTRTAIEMLEDATKMDPGFAEAWARLADASAFMAGAFDPRPGYFRKAERALRQALALDPTNAGAYCARGRVLWSPTKGFQNRLALRALGKSLRCSPGYHPARVWQCLIFLHVGMMEEAMEGLQTALATHPEDGFVLTFLAQAKLLAGNYDEAKHAFHRALAHDPASLWANLFFPMVPLYGPNYEDAEGLIDSAKHFFATDPLLVSWEALLWAKRGERGKAEQLVKKALNPAKSVLHTHHMLHTVATVYATLGKPAKAVQLLDRAARRGLPNYPVFRDDPHFQALRNYPPYVRLLTRLRKETEGYRREFSKG
jgi:eukaryotic-like serine/threonine-protein kinase